MLLLSLITVISLLLNLIVCVVVAQIVIRAVAVSCTVVWLIAAPIMPSLGISIIDVIVISVAVIVVMYSIGFSVFLDIAMKLVRYVNGVPSMVASMRSLKLVMPGV